MKKTLKYYACMYVCVFVYVVDTFIDELLSVVSIVCGEQWGWSANRRRRVDALGVRSREGHRGDCNLWWPPNLVV